MKHVVTETEVQALQEHLREHRDEALIQLACATGMRREELTLVTWSEVDLERREIHVLNSKTKRGVRVISLSEELAQVLRRHQRRQMEHDGAIEGTGPCPDLVFPDDAGGVKSPQRFLDIWHAALEHAGCSHLCFHDLRVRLWHRWLEQRRATREHDDES
jgi:integrase